MKPEQTSEEKIFNADNELKRLRCFGRTISNYPINLEVFSETDGWQQTSDTSYNEMMRRNFCEDHNWLNYTVSCFFCKDCGVVQDFD